uniref:COBRA C-terminal domain-containing protein n=1 Tax=Aegilops tauschii subsp. strangulata TaxID=200361 RepID=A0A453G811_AEGTS
TWTVTCTYSQFLALRYPTCCLSLSAFYSDTFVSCPKCSCGCQDNSTKPGICVEQVTFDI